MAPDSPVGVQILLNSCFSTRPKNRFCYKYEGESLEEIAPVLKPSEKIHYVISHDECCVHAGDMVNFEWMKEGEQPLRQKSRGRIVHISDFIFEHAVDLF